MLLWEDQFTDCSGLVIELSSLSTIEVFTMGNLELVENS